jgi:hypothetical protein
MLTAARRREMTAEFTISVSMGIDENDRQLLGFMELNGPDLYDTIGKLYGKRHIKVHIDYLNGFHGRNTSYMSRELSKLDSQDNSRDRNA